MGNLLIVFLKVRQWAEIQAHSRKMSLTEFLSFAEQKKSELQTALEVRPFDSHSHVQCTCVHCTTSIYKRFTAETGEFLPSGFSGGGQCCCGASSRVFTVVPWRKQTNEGTYCSFMNDSRREILPRLSSTFFYTFSVLFSVNIQERILTRA